MSYLREITRIRTEIVKIQDDMAGIRLQLRTLIELHRNVPVFRPDELTSWLLTLPDHLRKTWIALDRLGRARAPDVAAITGRARAVESSYLNQLAHAGVVYKEAIPLAPRHRGDPRQRGKGEVWFSPSGVPKKIPDKPLHE